MLSSDKSNSSSFFFSVLKINVFETEMMSRETSSSPETHPPEVHE